MQIRQLEVFLAAVREGTLSAAAESIGVSQPAASAALAALEREVRMPLLARGRRGVAPTQAGTVLAEHAEAILARLSQARAQLDALRAGALAGVRIGGFSSLARTFLPGVVAAALRLEPRARITTRVADTATLAAAVRSGELDLAVGYDDPDQPADLGDLRRIDLYREPLRVAIPPGHRLATGTEVRLADLADQDWIAPRPDHQIIRACRHAGFEPTVVAWTSDATAIRALVAAGVAVTLTPASMDADLAPAVPLVLHVPIERRVFAILPATRTSAGDLAQRAVVRHLQ